MTAPTATATPLPLAEPADLGFLPDRLARIGPAMQRYVDEGKVPNLVTLVARRGLIVHFEARGYMDLETRRPVSKDTLFRLYSNSKPIAGLAAMLLYEQGKLTPDDPVSKFIPAFRNSVVRADQGTLQAGLTEPARREITVRDLFRNTSGIASAGRVPLSYRNQYRAEMETLGWLTSPDGSAGSRSTRERVEALARLPLSFHPGSAYEYHAGYIVIGAIIEEITGQPLDRFYRERIFEPLGMNDSDWYIDEAGLGRFGDCYRPAHADGRWQLSTQERASESVKLRGPKTFFGAGGDEGGIIGTIGDYARFGQMLLNGGEIDGVRLLSRKTVEYMTSDHSEGMVLPMRGPGFGWGIGVVVRHSNAGLPVLRSVGAYGWAGAAGTNYLADPKEELLLVCFTQVMMRQMMPGNTYWEDFERLVYQALA
jgi:CubicO group peptidase (beta-lactamase class C family)